MISRHLLKVFLAMLAVVAAFVATVVEPRAAEAVSVTVKTCANGTITLSTAEKRLLDLHNKTRTRRGFKIFCVHPALTGAARSHSQEMLNKDYTAHDSYNGETLKARLERFGYTFTGYSYWLYGENIAWRTGSYDYADRCFKFWMNSPGHKANILSKNFREIGIGVRAGAFKTYDESTMCTVDFGTRR